MANSIRDRMFLLRTWSIIYFHVRTGKIRNCHVTSENMQHSILPCSSWGQAALQIASSFWGREALGIAMCRHPKFEIAMLLLKILDTAMFLLRTCSIRYCHVPPEDMQHYRLPVPLRSYSIRYCYVQTCKIRDCHVTSENIRYCLVPSDNTPH